MKRHDITETDDVFNIDIPESMKDEYSAYVVTLKNQLNGYPHYGLLYKYSLLNKQLSLLTRYRYYHIYNASIQIENIDQLFNFINNDNVLSKIFEIYKGYFQKVNLLLEKYEIRVDENTKKLNMIVAKINALESQSKDDLVTSYNILLIWRTLDKLNGKYNLKTFNN